jgi:tetratricopeptide (TPR) repeat protein
VSLCSFVSALILVYATCGFGQTAGWEQERQLMIQLRQQGRLREALETSRKMLAKAERHETGSAPLPLALHDYGVVAGDLTMYAEAEKALRRAIQLTAAAPPNDGSVLALFRLRLAELLLDAGRLNEARTMFVDLRRTWEQIQPGSVEHAAVLDHLAWLEVLRRNFGPAETLLQASMHILETRGDATPFRMGEVLNDYASLLFKMSRYEEAASYAERVRSIFERPGVPANSTLINTWMVLGAAYAYMGRSQEAEPYLRRSLSAAQSLFVEDSLRAGRLMAVAAMVLRRCGEKAEAKSLGKKATQILAKAGSEDPGRFTIDVNALR